MSGFTEAALERKLTELNNSQQSIQTLSLWLIHHRKHHKTIIQVWLKELKKVKPHRKLTFMYLANDVIQNSKKKGPEFTKEFGNVLCKAISHIALSDSDDKTISGLSRVLNVWKDRSIYSDELLQDFEHFLKKKGGSMKAHLDEEPVQKKKKVDIVLLKEEPEVTEKLTPGEPPDPDALIKALNDLENSASTDAAVREKIASLPPEVSDISILANVQEKDTANKLSKQVEEACTLISDYNSRLSQELEERKQLAQMLVNYTCHQKELLSLAEQKLDDYRDKLKQVLQVKNELNSHLQNLPDLTRLPSVTGGLAPLPSAGDLFSHS